MAKCYIIKAIFFIFSDSLIMVEFYSNNKYNYKKFDIIEIFLKFHFFIMERKIEHKNELFNEFDIKCYLITNKITEFIILF
jgi:hypothetical protein